MCIKPLYRWRIKQRAASHIEYQQECIERFGPFQAVKNQQAIWFHAVSVGETNAAQPLIEHYLKLGHAVLMTNTTKTGQARAKALFEKEPYLSLFQAVYLPVDQIALLKRFFQQYKPRLLALVETELWPNLIDQAKSESIPVLLINARLSDKSAKGYAKVSHLTNSMLKQLNLLLAQDIATQQRFIALGLPKQHSEVVGNIKFDITVPASYVEQAEKLKQQWSLTQRKIIVLASTHAPEEQQLLGLLAQEIKKDPTLLCIVVPRHPERFDEVFKICQTYKLDTARRSLKQAIQTTTQVYLADTMGELWLWYALSQVCFVGGSLNVPGGGHNILEPMALDIPTVVGPRYLNFKTIIDECLQAEAICVADNDLAIFHALMHYLQYPDQADAMVARAKQVLMQNQGSLQRHIQLTDAYLQNPMST